MIICAACQREIDIFGDPEEDRYTIDAEDGTTNCCYAIPLDTEDRK